MKVIFFLLFFGFLYFGFCSHLNAQTDSIGLQNYQAHTDLSKFKIPEDYCKFVNPFIGTGGHGHTFPGASAPFGFMQLSPDTRWDGWDGCGGYHYDDNFIYGFSHTHLSGTGVSDYGDILIIPQSGKVNLNSPLNESKKPYGSHFSHENEEAHPGYYKVYLDDSEVEVELSALVYIGIHKYNFKNEKKRKYILIDLDYRDQLLDYSMKIEGSNTVSGHRSSKAWAVNQFIYFYLQTNIDFVKSEIIDEDGRHQILLEFPINTKELLLKIGISAVDENGAKNNLENEIAEFDFNKVKQQSNALWQKELSKIYFEPITGANQDIFYTALYHTMLAPNTFSDFDGRYRGHDEKIHQLNEKEKQFTVFSLWDTYRATHPLFTIIDQKRTNQYIQTFQRIYDQRGDLPVWELAGNETECMIGFHSVSVIADAYAKNIRDYDYNKILEACIASSNFNEFGKDFFNKKGYIGMNAEPESVSKSLEYSYDNFCIAKMLELNGLEKYDVYKNYQIHLKRSMGFINHFDPQTKFMRPRNGGFWLAPFNPSEVNHHFTEANSWQYSLYAPHAIVDLTNLIGGKLELELWLDRLFTAKSDLSGREQADITGLIGQYAHGNEPSHHMAYLYNYTNAPFKTQGYIDKILTKFYTNKPDGLIGNEDCGQMSAWYILSAIGLYQITPGIPIYEIGRPLHNFSIISLENGKKFTIECIDNSLENKFIQKLFWNNIELYSLNISHQQIMEGGTLKIVMGNKPNSNLKNKTTTSRLEKSFVPLPYFENETLNFDEKIEVKINYPRIDNQEYTIFYNSGLNDKSEYFAYNESFQINKTEEICMYLSRNSDSVFGNKVCNRFIKADNNISLTLNSKFADQYSASGKNSLIDGLKGELDYRSGNWQGYFDQDFNASVNYKIPVALKNISVSFLEDTRSWVFVPEKIVIKIICEDGSIFKKEFKHTTLLNDEEVKIMTFTFEMEDAKMVKEVKVYAEKIEELPKWHISAGKPVWIFIDEISLTQ